MSKLKTFEFKCSCCDEVHKGIPNLGSHAPNYFYSVPTDERDERTFLTTNTCVVDDEHFFVRGCLEIPLIGFDDIFSFGAWVSLSESHFEEFQDLYNAENRSHVTPMFGWFSSWVWPFYEGTENIKTRIHLRDNGIRPFIELEPTGHPLAMVQNNGITRGQVIKMYEYYVHGKK